MDILYADRDLEDLCTDERRAKRELGPKGFKKLRARLADLEAAARVTDLVAGRPHPLKADRGGQFALDLDGACRLVFRSAVQPPPAALAGGIAWNQVTSIEIVYLGDYHD
ncbi:MAG: killer suppression protein HigA [Deltaproteobacteria bacterium]|nr:killer suppression protein HigA [Deltaproteobacteria bacterium]